MKRYVKANDETKFAYDMIKPLISEGVASALEIHNHYKEFEDDLPDYASIVDVATEYVVDFFHDMERDDFEELVKKYIDNELTDVEMI